MARVAHGVLAAALLVGRPAGLGVTVVAVAVLAVAARPRGAWGVAFWLLAAALAAVATLRAAGWIVWPSLVFAAALGSLAAAGGAAWWPVAAGIARAARFDRGFELVARTSAPPRMSWVTGTGLAVVLLAVFVPLFATADAAFAHLLGELVPDQAVDLPGARIATWIGVIGVGGGLLWAGRAPAVEPVPPASSRLGRTESTVPLIALVALFAAFVADRGGEPAAQRARRRARAARPQRRRRARAAVPAEGAPRAGRPDRLQPRPVTSARSVHPLGRPDPCC
jgi:hypothetical protein